MAPQAVAAGAINQVAGKAAAGQNNNHGAISDIDRILAKHPDAVNRDQLIALRNQLAGQQTAGSIPTRAVVSSSLIRRDTPLDRPLPHHRPDTLRLPTSSVRRTGTGIGQPPISIIPTGTILIPSGKRRFFTDISPVRLR
jgi:hypothetical protein